MNGVDSLTCLVAVFGVSVLVLYCSKPKFVEHEHHHDLDWTKVILYAAIPAVVICGLFSLVKGKGGGSFSRSYSVY